MNYVNNKLPNTLCMGCDYYIEHQICIHYNNNDYHCINLRRDKGYFSDLQNDFVINMDIENSNLTEWEKIKQYHLTPRAIPFTIYKNNKFVDIYVSDMYKEILESEMVIHRWGDVKEIVVVEKRYKRYDM